MSLERRTIDIQLAKLVKPHVLLYDGKGIRKYNDRRIIWEKICAELNEKFDLKLSKWTFSSISIDCSQVNSRESMFFFLFFFS